MSGATQWLLHHQYEGKTAHSGFYVAILNREVNWCRFHATPGTNITRQIQEIGWVVYTQI